MHQKAELVIVPFTQVEWRNIQRLFNSNLQEEMQEVSDYLNMWRTRAGTQTPVFIVVTEMIYRAILLDRRDTTQSLDEEDQILMFATVITRFINLINDCAGVSEGQDEAERTIKMAAVGMGVPGWIVEVRHSACHRKMPSLAVMKKAVEFMHSWLWTNFWQYPYHRAIQRSIRQQQEKWGQPQKGVSPTKAGKEQRSASSAYPLQVLYAIEKLLRWRKHNPHATDLTEGTAGQKMGKQVIRCISTYASAFISCFADLCLSRLQRNSSTTQHHSDEPRILSPPLREQTFFYPVFKALSNANLLVKLLLELVQQVSGSNTPVLARESQAMWLDLLLDAHLQEEAVSMLTQTERHTILNGMLATPLYFNGDKIEKLLERMRKRMTDPHWRMIHEVLASSGAICSGQTTSNGLCCKAGKTTNNGTISKVPPAPPSMGTPANHIYTVADIRRRLEEEKAKAGVRAGSEAGSKQNAEMLAGGHNDEDNWVLSNERGPLGLLHSQTAESLCLVMPQHMDI